MEHWPLTVISTVPPSQQRYDTLGDYQFTKTGCLHLQVSQEENNLLEEVQTVVHELGELGLCLLMGITVQSIDEWDMGEGRDLPDPGADPRAPYHLPHMCMLEVEKIIYKFAEENGLYGSKKP